MYGNANTKKAVPTRAVIVALAFILYPLYAGPLLGALANFVSTAHSVSPRVKTPSASIIANGCPL